MNNSINLLGKLADLLGKATQVKNLSKTEVISLSDEMSNFLLKYENLSKLVLSNKFSVSEDFYVMRYFGLGILVEVTSGSSVVYLNSILSEDFITDWADRYNSASFLIP